MLKLLMPVLIAMLRAVNVGGHNRIGMEALRALCESLDLRNPRTYVQSGNVIFGARERNLVRLARRIEDAIESAHGFRPAVILRTSAELRDVIRRNPFATRDGIHPSKLLVTFLAADPAPEAREKIHALKTDPDELHLDGRELYIYFPNGMGRSKLQMSVIDRALKTTGTGRNWNSVTKMLAIAEQLEAPAARVTPASKSAQSGPRSAPRKR